MAKQASLAAQSGSLTAADFQVPAVFQQPPAVPLEGRAMSPYITFAHPNRKDEWAKLVSKFGTVNDGDTFLVEPKGITALPTFRASILQYRKYFAQKDKAGNVTKTSDVETPVCNNEHVEAVLLVYLPDRCVPANVLFRTTKCAGAITLSEALVEAGTPEWAAKSEAHKATLIAPHAWMRFYGELTVKPPRTPRGGGNPYRVCSCDGIKPTGPTEWALVKAFCEGPGKELLELAAKRFQNQLADVEKLSK